MNKPTTTIIPSEPAGDKDGSDNELSLSDNAMSPAPDADGITSSAVSRTPPPKKGAKRGTSSKKAAISKKAASSTKPSGPRRANTRRADDKSGSGDGTPSAPAEPFVVYVRSLKAQDRYAEPFKAGKPLNALRAALDLKGFQGDEPVIGLKDASKLAVVDADWHYHDDAGNPVRRLNGSQAAEIARAVEPMPDLWWQTHGGGLRLVYEASPDMDADAKAALAIFNLWTPVLPRHMATTRDTRRAAFPTGAEIKTQTRHPGYPKADGAICGPVNRTGSMWGPQRVAGRLLGTAEGVDQEQVDEGLGENNWERGRAHPHDRCLINPGHASHGTPVWVGDHGINCLSCQAAGLVLPGCGTAGFVPWARLVDPDGLHLVNLLRNAVKHCCHWRQARHVARHCIGCPGIDEGLLEKLYRALLQLWHLGRLDSLKPEYGAVIEATKERIQKVFTSEARFVRAPECHVWDDDYATPIDDAGKQIVASLPAAMYVESKTPAKGQPTAALKANKLRAATLRSNRPDLSEFGYAVIDPIVGVDVGGVVGGPGDGRTVPALLPAAVPFRYRRKPERDEHRERDAAVLEGQFPGLDRNHLFLLIGAKGYSQRGFSEPIRIVFTGQSGAGKTTGVRVAAEMTGEPNERAAATTSVREPGAVLARVRRAVAQGVVHPDRRVRQGGRCGSPRTAPELDPLDAVPPAARRTRHDGQAGGSHPGGHHAPRRAEAGQPARPAGVPHRTGRRGARCRPCGLEEDVRRRRVRVTCEIKTRPPRKKVGLQFAVGKSRGGEYQAHEAVKPAVIDRAKGIVRDVRVLGRTSRNGKVYSERAILDGKRLLEQMVVYTNHPPKEFAGRRVPRALEDRFGRLHGLYVKNGDLYARELRYNTGHPLAESFAWNVQNDSRGIGIARLRRRRPVSPTGRAPDVQ